jgi:5-methylcytosine-specific restriction endonuclease McrA
VALLKFCLHCGKHYDPSTGVRSRCGPCGRKYDQRHSVERRARNSAKWQQARAAARRRDGERCRQCGSTDKLEVHHIVPLSEGGERYALSNLTTLCHDCHVEVGRGQGRRDRRTVEHPGLARGETHTRRAKHKRDFSPDNEIEPLVG